MIPARPRLAVFLLLESFWAAVAVALVADLGGNSSDPVPGWLSSTAMLWGAYATVRLAGRLRVEADTAADVSLGIGVVTAAVVLRLTYAGDLLFWQPGVLLDFLRDISGTYHLHSTGIAGGLALGGLWLRGGWLGRGGAVEAPPDQHTFVLGLAIIPLVMVAGEGPAREMARNVALPFALLGFVALALGHLQRTAPDRALPRWWAGAVPGVIAAALIAALVVPVLPWSALKVPVGPLLSGLADAAVWLLYLVLTPLFFAVEWLMRTVLGLFGIDELTPGQGDYSRFLERFEDPDGNGSTFPSWLWPAIRYSFITLMAALAALGGWWLLRRRIGMGGEGIARVDITGAGESTGRRSGRSGWRDGEHPGAGAIGRLYGDLLREAERRGFPRPLGRTPLEFAPELGRRLDTPAAVEISDVFARARYGGLLPDEAEVERLRLALQELGDS